MQRISSDQLKEFDIKSQQQIFKLTQQIEDLGKELHVCKVVVEDPQPEIED